MDMNAAYEQEVREQCPQAEIVYDLFHVVAKYGREVIDRVRVDEANRLKGDLKELWRLRDRNQARTAWESWVSRAIESGIAPLIAFANKLQKYLDGILSHCRWPLHTSLLEGFNNKIKLIKRMAYGSRDDHYFFLKIRAAFPGIRRRTKKTAAARTGPRQKPEVPFSVSPFGCRENQGTVPGDRPSG